MSAIGQGRRFGARAIYIRSILKEERTSFSEEKEAKRLSIVLKSHL
jgi:hypothetical protein